jgi:acyl-CoA thioesterase I
MLPIAWPLTMWVRLCAVALAVLVLFGPGGVAAADKGCPVASDVFDHEPYLIKTVAALRAGREITLVAVGGASTEGRAAGGPEASWPTRLAENLQERYPSAHINLVIRAAPRPTTADMVARLAKDVLPLKPTLVIWEAGTTDAVRGTDIEEFRTSLHAGIEALRTTPTEIILVDMQYSPMTHSVVYFNRYLVILRGVADVTDIPLFPRHRIMYDWSEMGLLATPDRNAEARRSLADWLYRCIGGAMADFVTRHPAGSNRQQ